MAQRLFTSQTPASNNVANGNSISLGTYFTPAVDGTISELWWFFPSGAQPGGEAIKGALFRTSDSTKLQADATFATPGTPNGWNSVAITPIPVLAGVQYCVGIRSPDRYVATTGGASPWPLTNGDLSAPSGAGRFEDDDGDGSVQFPTDSFNNGCYFPDITFNPAGAAAEGTVALGLDLALAIAGSTPAQGSVALALDLVLAGAGARASAGAAAPELNMAISASGQHDASGTSAIGLNLAVSASGSNGESGRPVTPWPFTPDGPSSYPWTPRAVKSFSEVES